MHRRITAFAAAQIAIEIILWLGAKDESVHASIYEAHASMECTLEM